MRIIITNNTVTISLEREEVKRLGVALGESYFASDKDELRARTGLAPELIAQFYDIFTDVKTSKIRVTTPLFGVEQIAQVQAGQADLEVVMDGDAVTMRLTRVGLRALGETLRPAAQNLSRPEYYGAD